jgi:hypothetical protein
LIGAIAHRSPVSCIPCHRSFYDESKLTRRKRNLPLTEVDSAALKGLLVFAKAVERCECFEQM